MRSISKELIGATAIPIILSALRNGDSYGYEIVQRVKEITHGKTSWQEASIYPVLKRLEKERLIKSYWRMNKNERPRKYYTILAEGEKQLELNKEEWKQIQTVFDVLWNSV